MFDPPRLKMAEHLESHAPKTDRGIAYRKRLASLRSIVEPVQEKSLAEESPEVARSAVNPTAAQFVYRDPLEVNREPADRLQGTFFLQDVYEGLGSNVQRGEIHYMGSTGCVPRPKTSTLGPNPGEKTSPVGHFRPDFKDVGISWGLENRCNAGNLC